MNIYPYPARLAIHGHGLLSMILSPCHLLTMGNKMMCLPIKDLRGGFASQSKKEKRRSPSRKKLVSENDTDHLSRRFDRFIINPISSIRPRTRRSLSEPMLGKQAALLTEKIETTKVVLVHGQGFGAWCWYKIIPLLEEAGMQPIALDLAGSGTKKAADINSIACLKDYAESLISHLSSLADGEKIILVGHSGGGAIISYAMELYPDRISKAVFISATMVADGQSPFDPFAEFGSAENFLEDSRNLVYGNGKEKPPTSLVLEKEQIIGLYFNRCSPKDVALASLSMNLGFPLAPMMEKMVLTQEKYGTVKRFFIQTLEDNILGLQIQEEIVRKNPPDEVYKIRGSDHSPFLSKPRSLNKILLEIAQA